MACQVNEDDDFQVHEYFNEEYFEQNGHSATKPITGLGSGDSMLFLNVLPDDLAESAFDTMNNEIDWHVMNHKGNLKTCDYHTMLLAIMPMSCHRKRSTATSIYTGN